MDIPDLPRADGSETCSAHPAEAGTVHGLAPDSSACERETIHIPGSIQPHGHLIILSAAGAIVSVSRHTLHAAGVSPEDIVGRSIAALLDDAATASIDSVLAAAEMRNPDPFTVVFRSAALAGGWEAIVNWHDGLCFVDIEPAPPCPALRQLGEWRQRLIAALELSIRTRNEVYGWLAGEVRELSGFERVMVYCFDRDFHGEVVADQHAAGLHSYLGHHFPAKDIPPQARALYVLNRTRIIPDARYRPEPLVPDIRPDTAVPIDLSHSTLRSVSPTHCEYMANMGIVASMSISIVSDGQLAAMIICHHRTPHFVPYRLRQTLELLARAVASRIAMLDRRSIEAVTEIVERAYNSIGPSTKRRGAGAVLEILGLPLLELMKSSGLALLSATNSVRIGETPNAAAIEEVVRAIRERHDVGVFTSERMSDLYTSERKSAFACGVMALQLPRSQEWLIWFRPEWEHTRIWAGNPNEQALSNGKINPRHSFADWKEIVLGQSRPWDEIDIAAARKLASLIG